MPVVAWIYQETGVILSSTEELVFTSIDRSQAGSYKCHAFNGIGSNSTRKCSLDVFCKYDLLYRYQGVQFLFFPIFSYFLSLFLFSPIFKLKPPIFPIF